MPREVVFGMDRVERSVSFFGVAIAIIVSLVPAYAWFNKSPLNTTVKKVKGKACAATYKLNGQFCEHTLKNAQSHWAIQFLFVFVVALIMLAFTLARKRAGVACFACFLGIGLGVSGVVFVFLGAWLIVRAFRLQRYGEASWTGSNKIAREMAQARKEGREVTPRATSSTTPAAATGPVAPPTQSKRYTPKQKPRKR